MDQVLTYKMGTALMPGERKESQASEEERMGGRKKKGSEVRRKGRMERGHSYDGWFNHNMGSLVLRLEGGNPKHFWPPNMSWLLAYPCKGLAVPTEVSSQCPSWL